MAAWASGAWASGAWAAGTWQGIGDASFTSSYGPHPGFRAELEEKKPARRKARKPDENHVEPKHYVRDLPKIKPVLNATQLMNRAEAETRLALKKQLRAQALEEDEWLFLA